MRIVVLWGMFTVAIVAGPAGAVAQEAQAPTREATIEETQADKVKDLHPYVPNKAERVMNRFENAIINGPPRWHPFFDSAYPGGGFTLGAGYAHHLSSYNLLDVRGSYTITGYKRVEAEFVAPELFSRRGTLSLLGGWREATEVGFYGLGTDTSKDDRTNYDFKRPYASGLLTIYPTRRNLLLRGGLEWTQWSQDPGHGSFPSVETVFTPETLPGLDATATYLHTQATVGFDWRTSPGYTRRGGYYGVTGHDYHDRDSQFGFRQVDYEAIQHFPILREAWVISLHGLVQTAFDKNDQQTPFFMLPVGWQRILAARLQQLALPRPEQSAPAGGVANHGESLLRHRGLLRRGESHRPHLRSRSQEPQERLRLRHPLPQSDLDADPARAGQRQRRPDFHLFRLSCLLRLQPWQPHRFRPEHTLPRSSRSWSSSPACSPARPRPRDHVSIQTIRSHANPSRRTHRKRSPTRSATSTR